MHRFSIKRVSDAIDIGLIIVDVEHEILLWNEWMARHSSISHSAAMLKNISHIFLEEPSQTFILAIDQVLKYGSPVVMSNLFHRSPLPLYQMSRFGSPQKLQRIHQSIKLTPIYHGAEPPCCMIQITDASMSSKREEILRDESDRLRTSSITDSLTGIYNRRFFDEHFQLSLSLANRERTPLSICIIDIDFFKDYNDHYGHLAGDHALIAVAEALKSQQGRNSDVLARFGGEEFVLMLPNTDMKHAAIIASNMQNAITNLLLKHAKSQVADYLTVNMGISTFDPENEAKAGNLLDIADRALYQAKRNGRNQFVIANSSLASFISTGATSQ